MSGTNQIFSFMIEIGTDWKVFLRDEVSIRDVLLSAVSKYPSQDNRKRNTHAVMGVRVCGSVEQMYVHLDLVRDIEHDTNGNVVAAYLDKEGQVQVLSLSLNTKVSEAKVGGIDNR